MKVLWYLGNQWSSLCSTSHFWTWAAPQRRRKEAKSRRLNSHTLTLFFPACFFSKLTCTMCRTYIVYTCTSPLPSPFSPFLHKVLLSAWCGELPDKKTPSLVQKVWEEMKNLCWLWMLNQSHQVCRRLRHHQCHQQHTISENRNINIIWVFFRSLNRPFITFFLSAQGDYNKPYLRFTWS